MVYNGKSHRSKWMIKNRGPPCQETSVWSGLVGQTSQGHPEAPLLLILRAEGINIHICPNSLHISCMICRWSFKGCCCHLFFCGKEWNRPKPVAPVVIFDPNVWVVSRFLSTRPKKKVPEHHGDFGTHPGTCWSWRVPNFMLDHHLFQLAFLPWIWILLPFIVPLPSHLNPVFFPACSQYFPFIDNLCLYLSMIFPTSSQYFPWCDWFDGEIPIERRSSGDKTPTIAPSHPVSWILNGIPASSISDQPNKWWLTG